MVTGVYASRPARKSRVALIVSVHPSGMVWPLARVNVMSCVPSEFAGDMTAVTVGTGSTVAPLVMV